MSDDARTGAGPGAVFGVETIVLDLPPLVTALSRRLYDYGLPVTPGRSTDFARALAVTRPITRRRLYWTARAVFVTDPSQVAAFDTVFFSVFGDRTADDAFDPEEAGTVTTPRDARSRSSREPRPTDAEARLRAVSMAASTGVDHAGEEEDEVEVPLLSASDEELLRRKSFDALEPYELVRLYRLMARLRLVTPERRTRRYEKGSHGGRIDLRRTLRTSLRTGGDPIRLARRRRRMVRRRLVMLCDISGSMEPYARAYLQFLTCAARSGPDAEAFAFATRLTRLTRALASRNPERAMARAAAAAPDWSSGTRIGEALREFNNKHGRRGMARGAVIVILSDGWERGDPMLVGREMERLARLAYRIVWVNPRVGARSFSVRSGGMVAALPYLDVLVSGHNFEALGEVVEAIGMEPGDATHRSLARWEPVLPAAVEDDEPWGSATPAPGSSVAMPSGYGPSRGNTTPGWGTGEGEK